MKNNFGTIFDMDGVLVDSNPVHKKTIDLFCKKYNHNVGESFLKERVYGRTNKEWIPEVFGDISEEDARQLADEKEQMFRERFSPSDAAVPGVHAFLQNLHSLSVPCVVATSAPRENADFILSELDISHFFDAVLDSSHVTKGKPDPEVYLKAAEAIRLPPSRCVVFEDSLAGVEAGLKAGTRVVGISTTHTPEEMNQCSLVFKNFQEVNLHNLSALFD